MMKINLCFLVHGLYVMNKIKYIFGPDFGRVCIKNFIYANEATFSPPGGQGHKHHKLLPDGTGKIPEI